MTAASLASMKKSDAPLRHVCPLIVNVGGTFREQSTSDRALEVALARGPGHGHSLDTRLAERLRLVRRQIATFAGMRHKFTDSSAHAMISDPKFFRAK
jgi:hypothetical protein